MSMNSSFAAAQANTALVPANNELSTAVQKPAALAPADTEMIETTFADEKEQAPVQSSTTTSLLPQEKGRRKWTFTAKSPTASSPNWKLDVFRGRSRGLLPGAVSATPQASPTVF